MADERYQWLDLEAAERLLRGDRVEAVDDHARAEAETLAEALESARPAALSGTAPLPGEEAAMAAFRAAAHARVTAPDAVSAPAPAFATAPDPAPSPVPVPAPAALGDVRLGAPAGRRARRRRWTRSMRFGLAASVAGLAVGGVAVAAGTGMLPTPFGPVPASSVSAAVTPGPVESGSTAGGGESRTPGHGDASGPVPTPTASGGPSETSPPRVGGTEGPERGTPDATLPDKDRAGMRAKYLTACQDLRAGRIDASDRRRLAEATRGGSQTVKAFCDRLLGDEEKDGGSGEGASGGNGDDDGQNGRTTGSEDGTGSGSDENDATGARTGSVSDRASGADAETTPVPVVSFQPLFLQPAGMDDEAASAPSHSA
ncbi:hypothetical protein AB0C77_08455 [Streptomyces sp. NPDC048629]|uniref:hypothetical protein n=1 Tax=Streptomyces sp. NPDC048629 TaxID=3154824 RepID=UPI003422834B